jgi:hypothetical protein
MATMGEIDRSIMPPKLSDEEETGRINVTAPMSFVRAVEEWRIQQRPVLTMAKAVRVLVERALEAERCERQKPKDPL